MLILTRSPDEAIMIGDDVSVRILEVRGNQVRIGITAPRSTSVDREEIFERKRGQGLPAGISSNRPATPATDKRKGDAFAPAPTLHTKKKPTGDGNY